MDNSSLLIIFLKAPVPGLVKTRLADAYGVDKACNIYKELTETILHAVQKWRNETILFYYPPDGKSIITDWLGEAYQLVAQTGDDIGEKMKNAFVYGFNKGAEKIVLIGTDIPELDEKTIEDAYLSLQNNDCVIGPSTDGGYYLIGLNRRQFRKEIFENIHWSTDSVLQDTLGIIRTFKLSADLLDFKTDIDTPGDYVTFYGSG